jgi:hypothetical protein
MRSSWKSGRRPAHRWRVVDRGCPLGTVVVRPFWHAAGTNGRPRAARRPPRDGAPPRWGTIMWAQVELARQGCTFGLTCQDAGVSRIRRAWLRGNDLEVRAGPEAVPHPKVQHRPSCSTGQVSGPRTQDHVGKPPSGGAAAGVPASASSQLGSCQSAQFPVQFASSLPNCTGECTD